MDAPTEPAYQTVVSGQRLPRTASETTLAGPLLETAPRKSADDFLRTVPGLLVARHGTEGKGYQIFLRGFDAVHGADLEVTLEGIPLNELSNVHGQGYLDLGLLVGDAVSRVRVVKGPFSAEQGPFATAGSVRFELGAGTKGEETSLGYEFGTTLRHRLSGVHARGSNVLAAEAVADQGFGENRDLQRAGVIGAWEGPRIGEAPLRFIGAVYGAEFGEPGVVPLADVEEGRLGFYDVHAARTRGRSLRAIAGVSHVSRTGLGKLESLGWAQARSLSLEENFTGFLLDAEEGDTRRQTHEARGGGARLQLTRSFGRLKFEGGLSWLAEHVSQAEERLALDFRTLEQSRAHTFWQHAGGAWSSLRFRPLAPLQVELGARVDLFHFDVQQRSEPALRNAATLAELSPRLQLGFDLLDSLTLFGSLGRGVRPPEARAVTGGTPGRDPSAAADPLASTAADAAELGARWDAARSLSLSAVGFLTLIARERIFDHLAGVSLERNATRRIGTELLAQWRPAEWLELRADLTLVDARFVESAAPVPGAPTVLGGLSGGVVHPDGYRLGARVLALGPRPLANGARAGAALILDLSAGYLWRQFELTLQVENATDARWREGEFHYASWFDRSTPRSALPQRHFAAGPPRIARIGLAYHFD